MDRDELVEVVAQALSEAWKSGVLFSQREPGGVWFNDYEKFASVAIDAGEEKIRADERAKVRALVAAEPSWIADNDMVGVFIKDTVLALLDGSSE